MLKKSISIITAITFFSGCAVKQEDSTATKALKHTVNAPVYLVLGVGMIGTLAIQGAILAPAAAVNAIKPKSEENSETKVIEVKEKEKIESVEISDEDKAIKSMN
jgi:Zn-dependent alcohol dehydrogenase